MFIKRPKLLSVPCLYGNTNWYVGFVWSSGATMLIFLQEWYDMLLHNVMNPCSETAINAGWCHHAENVQ